MSIVRRSAEQARKSGRIDRKILRRTGEAQIAAQAREDESNEFLAAWQEGRSRVVEPVNVTAIRAKTGLSQERFARAFRISPHTLRNWEQGRRQPEGPAKALLLAIERDPKALVRALRA